ncbi:MAG: hypothetical protein LUH47_01945 [Clostridiales bacterium]|nr:hypothetical protein [Clostridiales bacterium]
MTESVNAPVETGAKLGEMVYYFGGEEVGRVDITAEEGVEKAGIFDTAEKILNMWFSN